jgi:hypothetical protein
MAYTYNAGDFASSRPGEALPGCDTMNDAPVAGDLVARFESLEHLCKAARVMPMRTRDADLEWFGNVPDIETAIRMTKFGEPGLVQQSDALLTQIEDYTDETPRREWVPSPAGVYPIVPEAISGSPTPMRQIVAARSVYGPMNVYINTSASQMYDKHTLLKRGIAILALVRKLSEIRPVDLWILGSQSRVDRENNTIVLTRIETRPIDLAVLAFVLGNCGFERWVHHSMAFGLSPRVGRSLPFAPVSLGNKGHGTIKEYLKLGEDDLYIPPAHFDTLTHEDPIQWVNKKLREILGGKQ